MLRKKEPRGFSLLEVLIALVIFSLGLLGMAGLMVMSVKTNQSAYLRTQASFIAESMANRMRANLGHLTAYNDTYSGGGGSDPCADGVACSTGQIVQRDAWLFQQQLEEFLPAATADIECDGTTLGTSQQSGASPFDGLCTISMAWSESTLDRTSDGSPDTQTFAWVFQP